MVCPTRIHLPIWTWSVGLLVTCVTGSLAAEVESKAAVVVRLAPKAHPKTFAKEQKVNDLVLGTTIKGDAKTTGECAIRPCQKAGELLLRVTGVSVTTSEGRNGPAIIHSTTTTRFVATAPLRYRPETGFSKGEIEVEADTETTTNDIQSTQGGIAGALVKKLAAKKIAESKEEAQEIARDLAVKRIRNALESELDDHLARLNECYHDLKPVVAAIRGSGHELIHLATKEGCLLVAARPANTAPDAPSLELPERAAQAEVWLQRAAIDSETTRKLASLARPVSVSTTAPENARAATQLVLDHQEQWLVMRVTNAQSVSSSATAK